MIYLHEIKNLLFSVGHINSQLVVSLTTHICSIFFDINESSWSQPTLRLNSMKMEEYKN